MRGSRLGRNSMEQDSFDSSDSSMPMEEERQRNGVAHDEEGRNGASIIVTNVDINVFDDITLKREFEHLFLSFDSLARLHFLRSFRRVRVDFADANAAEKARRSLHNTTIASANIQCFALQVGSALSSDTLLPVPGAERQLLLSPPPSPPFAPMEDTPIRPDHQLAQAMAQLMPGEKHELHPMREINVLGKSVSTPSIVVHVAEDAGPQSPTIRFRQAFWPDRQRSLD